MQQKQGLYDPAFEHDACGIGFTANLSGDPQHRIIEDGLTILKKLVHRGAETNDATGDGAGMLFGLPYSFFEEECAGLGIRLPETGKYGVGMFFLPRDVKKNKRAVGLIEKACRDNGARVIGWRAVPVSPGCLGEKAELSRPEIRQAFISCGGMTGDELERKLYIIRKVIEKNSREEGFSTAEVYPVSLSSRTIVYKGMFVAPQLESFYDDLRCTDFKSPYTIVHQRYSTNTFPSWVLAQPFRCIAHNGGNKHPPRQPEQDEIEGAQPEIGSFRRRYIQTAPDHESGPERFREFRRGSGTPLVRRSLDRTRIDDDDAGGLRPELSHQPGPARFL